MVSRGIYVILVPDLTAEYFIQALRALAWTHGQPKVMLLDNATCFTAAKEVLKNLKENIELKTPEHPGH